MNEIEKMYSNAGIEPECQDYCCKIADKYWAGNTEGSFEYLMQKECPYNLECTGECEYAYDKAIYPSFTSEKQLKLIEFFINSVWWLNLKSLDETLDYSLNFENKLAKLVNRLWQ